MITVAPTSKFAHLNVRIKDCHGLKIVEVSNDMTFFRSFLSAVNMFMDYWLV
jgi:hypothetical protein